MEDVVINGYTQVLLAAIGTSLVGAIGALWIIIWRLVKENTDSNERFQDKYIALVDRYHTHATNMERLIERGFKG